MTDVRRAGRGTTAFVLGLAVAAGAVVTAPPRSTAAAKILPGRGALPDGPTNLPVFLPDPTGQQWMVYQNGMLRQSGNVPVYGQAAQLTVNGNQPQSMNAAARVEGGEVVLENMQSGQVSVTRRVKALDDGVLRVVDVLANAAATDLPVTVTIQSNINYGVTASNVVTDPGKKSQTVGWAAQTGGNRAVAEVFAGKGARTAASVQVQPNNQFSQATYSFTIPAGKSAALWHLHATAANLQAASQLVTSIDETKMLRQLPKEVRALLVNVAQAGGAGDLELPRGEPLDVVELRNGDRLTGTNREPAFRLAAAYGTIELTPDRVLGLVNVGQFRPRQLLVTGDGQVFGGTLAKETVDVELSGGQVTTVPLRQIARAGYRQRPGDPELGAAPPVDAGAAKPMVFLRDGDRVAVTAPAGPVTVATRYGQLSLPPTAVASVTFAGDDVAVHSVRLTDGSTVAGFVTAATFDAPLVATGQPASFPVGDLARVALAAEPGEVDDAAVAVLRTTTGDALVGTLAGTLKLDTAFDTIALAADQLRGITRAGAGGDAPAAGRSGGGDVQVTTWEGGTLSGRLQDPLLDVRLTSGVAVRVPVSLLATYSQPAPQPSGQVLERIRAVVAELSADDWKQRDRAEAQLVAMGPSVAGVLRQLRGGLAAEPQQRIDAVLKQFEKAK